MRRGRSRPRGRREPVVLGSLVDGVLGDLGLEAAAVAFRIGQRWQEWMEPEVAGHSRPIGVRGPVLEVEVDSSVWCQELRLRAPEILAVLSRELGEESPSELRLRVRYTRRP